jgi:RNA recognition motif-containing protein
MQEMAAGFAQQAQRAELAAAAIRAQAHMEAHENDSARPAANRSQEQQKNSSMPLEPTSVMLRHLPLDLTRDMLLTTLDQEGFESQYDFVYLPRDFGTGANLGYAFVNLLNHSDALRMQRHFDGFQRWSIHSAKRCVVVWSNMQGVDSYVRRYKSLAVNESIQEDCRPMFFRNGVQAPFPKRTDRKARA